MDKVAVLKHLVNDDFPNGIADVICDIYDKRGILCYPNESILVFVYNDIDFNYNIPEDELDAFKHYAICESIDDFIDGVVYGYMEARERYCGYYVGNFKKVKPFKGKVKKTPSD